MSILKIISFHFALLTMLLIILLCLLWTGLASFVDNQWISEKSFERLILSISFSLSIIAMVMLARKKQYYLLKNWKASHTNGAFWLILIGHLALIIAVYILVWMFKVDAPGLAFLFAPFFLCFSACYGIGIVWSIKKLQEARATPEGITE